MFVSYNVADSGYGYMCFSGFVTISWLIKFIEDRVFSKVSIIFMSAYSTKKTHNVYMHTNGVYRFEKWDKPLANVNDIGDLYTHLYNKYGFTNILGYY